MKNREATAIDRLCLAVHGKPAAPSDYTEANKKWLMHAAADLIKAQRLALRHVVDVDLTPPREPLPRRRPKKASTCRRRTRIAALGLAARYCHTKAAESLKNENGDYLVWEPEVKKEKV